MCRGDVSASKRRKIDNQFHWANCLSSGSAKLILDELQPSLTFPRQARMTKLDREIYRSMSVRGGAYCETLIHQHNGNQ